MRLQVISLHDLRISAGSGSSFEDDVGQGPQASIHTLRPAVALRTKISNNIGYEIVPVVRSVVQKAIERRPGTARTSPGFDVLENHLKERYEYAGGPSASGVAGSDEEARVPDSKVFISADESGRLGEGAGASLLEELRSVMGKVEMSSRSFAGDGLRMKTMLKRTQASGLHPSD